MNTFFGTLQHLFAMADPVHMIWCIIILLTMLILAILHHRWREDDRKIRLWRFLCLIPLLTAIIHYAIYAASPILASGFIILYFIAILALLPIPFARRKIGYRITAILTGVFSLVCGFCFCATSPHYHNFSRMSYTDSFHALVQEMDRTYVLKEWKEIDFARLEETYLPLVEEAEQEQNPAKFCDAVTMFCNELHDAHVFVMEQYDKEQHPSPYGQHEYGLAMVQLDNGDVVAVCTTDEVQKLGIKDGTVITHWNGKPILQAAEDVMDQGFPVKSNEDRIAVMQLSAVGGDTVDVTFSDQSGKETTVTLSDLGEQHSLREAVTALTQVPPIETQKDIETYLPKNLETKMLDDKCGYLVLNREMTDNILLDYVSYMKGDHPWAREMFREKLRELKALGMEYLVIDLRNNYGGKAEVGYALVSLLTKDDQYGQGLGIRKDGAYTCVSDHIIHSDGEFADLEVVALTNYNCVSAGDSTAMALAALPHVTLAGITDSSGSNQETGGMCLLSDGALLVGFPTGLILDENGLPKVDTAADCISRNPVEVRIPFDYDAAMQMFHEKEDYELAWAMGYLKYNADSHGN